MVGTTPGAEKRRPFGKELLEPRGWARTSGLDSKGPGFLLTFNAESTQRQVTATLTFTNAPRKWWFLPARREPPCVLLLRLPRQNTRPEQLNPWTIISPTFGGRTSRIEVPTREVSLGLFSWLVGAPLPLRAHTTSSLSKKNEPARSPVSLPTGTGMLWDQAPPLWPDWPSVTSLKPHPQIHPY